MYLHFHLPMHLSTHRGHLLKSSLPAPQLLIMSPSYAGEIVAVCTEHAANLLCEQLELAGKVDYQFKQDPHKEYMFELTYKDHKHFVDIDSNSCSCSFSKTLGLPYRHAFAARKKTRSCRFLHLNGR